MEDDHKTPIKNKVLEKVKSRTLAIPPSPQMLKLGYGTGVTVYKLNRSSKTDAQSPWALKKVNSRRRNTELEERIRDEAAVLRRLKHPNIIGFRAYLKYPDGRPCLAMEECDTSVGELIEERYNTEASPFPPAKIARVLVDVSKALKYLHEEALILHADLKSYNILTKGDFAVCKLCDFGVCLPLKPDGYADADKLGDVCEYVGTYAWCSPEVLGIEPVITAKADIYALGIVVWEMLALTTPTPPEEDEEGNEPKVITRPDLPDFELGKEFYGVLEVFYCCTHADFKRRPTAEDLCDISESL